MKSVILIFLFTISVVQNRPQTDEQQQWTYIWKPVYRIARRDHHQSSSIPQSASSAATASSIARGSPEETRIILNEIDKINVAFGYKPKNPPKTHQRQTAAASQANANSYFYPVPIGVDYNDQRPPYYRLPITEKENYGRSVVYEFVRSQRPEGITVLEEILRGGRNILVKKIEENPSSGNQVIETISNLLPGPSTQEVEDVYDSLDETEGSSEAEEEEEEEEEEELIGTTLNPPLNNDKFLHQEYLQKKNKTQIEQNVQERGFNFNTTFIKDLTEKFTKAQTTAAPEILEGPLKEKPLQDYDEPAESEDTDTDADVEGIKAPWSGYLIGGPQNQRELLKGGGLIIQRLRVRNGSIAVAGPGGVATAGSGGTAIVGPEGLAITHPRALTIAGQGARVFEVPETVDLQKQLLKLDANGTPPSGKLVAVGPAIHYNGE